MYAANSEQAVKMRGLAQKIRHEAQETEGAHYRRMFENAALDLESAAERAERAGWRPPH
jgi:hypothetical protein